MDRIDEPILSIDADAPDIAADPQVRQGIYDLLHQQPFAVLCTQGSGQPYGSVVAFAANEELNGAVFATARATRKYNLLCECDRIALVVDSRSTYPNELMKVEAITATGQARELPDGERDVWAERLVARHPQLERFVDSPSTALFRIEITRYLYVTRFQEVHQWVPKPATVAEQCPVPTDDDGASN